MGLTRGGLNTFLGLDRELIGEGGLSERGLKGECTLLKYQRANIGLSSLCYNTVIVILQGPRNDFESLGAKLKLTQFSNLV